VTHAGSAAAAAQPHSGTLAVTSEPWATVYVDNASHGQTDLSLPLPPGPHAIKLVVSAGGGTFTATAMIEADRKTRCRGGNGKVVCEPPR
jgi:hypothetical protein